MGEAGVRVGVLRVRIVDVDDGIPLTGAHVAVRRTGEPYGAVAAGGAGVDGWVVFPSAPCLELQVYGLDITLDVVGAPDRSVFATVSALVRVEDPARDHEVYVERSRFGVNLVITRQG